MNQLGIVKKIYYYINKYMIAHNKFLEKENSRNEFIYNNAEREFRMIIFYYIIFYIFIF